MSWKVGLNFICLQILYLPTHHQKTSVNSTKGEQKTLSVLHLLALINNRLSPLHASRYTAPTWPRSAAMNLPVRPSHTRTLLSQQPTLPTDLSGAKRCGRLGADGLLVGWWVWWRRGRTLVCSELCASS